MTVSWTDAMKRDVHDLLGVGGKSASQAAGIINQKYDVYVTRNAIIGIAHRSGIRMKTSNRASAAGYLKVHSRIVARAAQPKIHPALLAKKKSDHPVTSAIWELVELTGTEKQLADLSNKECHFPLDGPTGRVYCSQPVFETKSYCEGHCIICFTLPKKLLDAEAEEDGSGDGN